jgi:hypothetical protein
MRDDGVEIPCATSPSDDAGRDTPCWEVPDRAWSTLSDEAVPLRRDIEQAHGGEERRERLRFLLGQRAEQR